MMVHKDFLAAYAQTLNFTLGVPKAFKLSADGQRIFFLRTRTGTSFTTAGNVDPEAERLRKERMREAAVGITAYSVDAAGAHVAFGMGGDVFVYAVEQEKLHFLAVDGAMDVGISPDGTKLAYVYRNALYVAAVKADGIAVGERISPAATEALLGAQLAFIRQSLGISPTS